MATKKYLKRTDSKNTLTTFVWNKDVATVFPDFSFNAVIQMVDDDPVARGAILHFIDKCMEGGISIVKAADLSYDRDFEKLLQEKYMFRSKILRTIFYLGKLFNNVFIEIVRDTDNRVKSLNILDSENIEPITNFNGDPESYKSKVPNAKTGQYARWNKNEIVWIKFNDRVKGYAPVDLKALWETLLCKSWIKRYVAWLWKTGQYRVLYNIKDGASNDDIKDFLTYARKHDDNFRAPFLLKGDLEMKMVRDMKETQDITTLLKYWDNQTLILLRIPPSDAGIPDQSGRSNADAQSNNLNTHIISMKTVVEDYINFDLFKKMNKGDTLLKFAPVDRFSEEQIIKNVNVMKNIGMTEDVIREYLQDRGMFFQSSKLFDDPEEKILATNRDINTMNSRIDRKEEGGTGEQASTRPDQLKKQ